MHRPVFKFAEDTKSDRSSGVSISMSKQHSVHSFSKQHYPTLESFIRALNFQHYNSLSDEEKDEFLKDIDAYELYTVLKNFTAELGMKKIENCLFTEFLQKNDPKLLQNLNQRRKTAKKTSEAGRSSTLRRSDAISVFSYSTAGSSVRKPTYDLTLQTKIDMTKNLEVDIERRIKEAKSQGMQKIKQLSSQIEELQFRSKEAKALTDNFRLHFLNSPKDLVFLETASERLIENKFRKFLTTFNKTANSMLATMRMQVLAVRQNYTNKRQSLIAKTDLSDILGVVDFKQLKIKCADQKKSLYKKEVDMRGLKGVVGKVSQEMVNAKRSLMALEENYSLIKTEINKIIKSIHKLEMENDRIKKENLKLLSKLKHLKYLLQHYEAPSIDDYICQKEKLTNLEKEDKMLDRKIAILTMKLKKIQMNKK